MWTFSLGCVLWKCRAWLTLWTRPWQGLCPLSLSLFTVFVHSTVTGPLPPATITSYRELWKSVRSHTLSSKNAAPHCSNSIHPTEKKNPNTGIRMSARCLSWMINCLQPQTVLDWLIKRLVLWKLNALWTLFGNFESRALNHISRQELLEYLFLLQLVTKSNHKIVYDISYVG